MRDDIYRLIDAHDYRRRRPRGMVQGCVLIQVYLDREMWREGKESSKNTLSLGIAAWKLVDWIRLLSRLPPRQRNQIVNMSATLIRRLQSDTRLANKKAIEQAAKSRPPQPPETQQYAGHRDSKNVIRLDRLESLPKGSRIVSISLPTLGIVIKGPPPEGEMPDSRGARP
jgi:hypothetical protein